MTRLLLSRRNRRRAPVAIVAIACAALLAPGLLGCGQAPQAGGGEALDLDSAEMKAAMVEMLKISDTLDRHRRMVQLVDAVDASNLEGAVEAYEENLSRVDPHEIRIFTNKWAQLDPKGALDRILENWRYPRINNQAVLEVVYEWALSGEGAAARAYVDPLYEGPIESPRSPTKFMVLAVLQALGVAKDWDQLTDMLGAHEDDGDRELWITEVMVEINRANGLSAVKEWLDSIPWDAPHELKVSAMKRGLHWVANLSGRQSADWYEEIEDHPKAIQVLPMAVKAWGVRDPVAATQWLLARQETTVRDTLIREIARGWMTRDAAAAEAWILANAGDETIQRATVIPLANFMVGDKRFPEAAEVVRVHAPAEHKVVALSAVLKEWASVDEALVDAYIEEKGVSDDVIAAYERRLANRAIKVKRRRKGMPAVPAEESR